MSPRIAALVLALLAAAPLAARAAAGDAPVAAPSPSGPPTGCRPYPALAAQAVSADAADRLRLAPSTTRLARVDGFLLRDGRVLVQPAPGWDGLLLAAAAERERQALLDEALRARRASAYTSFHPLRGLLDDGAHFPADVPALLARLRVRLGGADPRSAASIDSLAKRWSEAGCRPDPALFHELTAAAGEIARARYGGVWSPVEPASPDPDAMVEPAILVTSPMARRMDPWAWVLRLLAGEPVTFEALLTESAAGIPALPAAH